MYQVHEPRQDYYMRSSDLFDNWVYLEDVCDTLCIAMVELPNLLSLCDVRNSSLVNLNLISDFVLLSRIWFLFLR